MNITVFRRFEFSAAHSAAGPGPEARLHGHNYVLHLGVRGSPDPVTGMVINLADLKTIGSRVLENYDHRWLNADVPRFQTVSPTVEAIAQAVWDDLQAAFPPDARPAAVRLFEDGGPGAEISAGATYNVLETDFSAAHRTHVPTLSDMENLALFGACNNPAGHGHNYGVRLTAALPMEALQTAWHAVAPEFDHRNLSVDIPDFHARNVTTEVIAQTIWQRLADHLAARRYPKAEGQLRVRVNELPGFFAAFHGREHEFFLGRRHQFRAAHRLASPKLSATANEALYGKCARPSPHGHTYTVEITLRGQADTVTGMLVNLSDFDGVAGAILGELDYRNLDAEAPYFADRPSTGENIAAYLWERFAAEFGARLWRVQLWETRNNLFEAWSFDAHYL